MTVAAALHVLKSQSLPTLVLEQVEKMIMDGRFAPGEQLREVLLAELLGISRGPIREAFRGLEEKGLVTTVKNRGVFVRTISPREADDLYEVRIPIETLIVTRLANTPGRLAGSGLKELLAKAEKLAKKGDFAGCHACNIEYHDRLAVLTGNAALIDVYRRLANALSLFRHHAHSRIADASSLRASVADHQAILSAINDGDGALASRLIVQHVDDSRRRTQHYIGSTSFSTETASEE
jgi:DNA-binding GntR family transcriptional regulator